MNKFRWLVRRELWEARTVWVAPAICAAIMIGGTLVAAFGTRTLSLRGIDSDELAHLHEKLTPQHLDGIAGLALGGIAVPFFILVLFTQFFYAIDALYGERRDRAILFWKSMPVSDTETILSKLFVAALVMPLVAMAAAFVTQLAVFTIGSATLASLELLQGHLWSPSLWGGTLLVMLYVVVAAALWYLPLLGWALFVSAAAPRAPLVYATLPPLAVGLAEYIVFRTHYALAAIGARVGNLGFFAHAFTGRAAASGFGITVEGEDLQIPRSLASAAEPGRFFTSPELWIGVAIGALLVAAAIWVRRNRDEAA